MVRSKKKSCSESNYFKNGNKKKIGSKLLVFKGCRDHTKSGLKKNDLVKNKNGRIISKKKQSLGKKNFVKYLKNSHKRKTISKKGKIINYKHKRGGGDNNDEEEEDIPRLDNLLFIPPLPPLPPLPLNDENEPGAGAPEHTPIPEIHLPLTFNLRRLNMLNNNGMYVREILYKLGIMDNNFIYPRNNLDNNLPLGPRLSGNTNIDSQHTVQTMYDKYIIKLLLNDFVLDELVQNTNFAHDLILILIMNKHKIYRFVNVNHEEKDFSKMNSEQLQSNQNLGKIIGVLEFLLTLTDNKELNNILSNLSGYFVKPRLKKSANLKK